jgi:hypothetical protein
MCFSTHEIDGQQHPVFCWMALLGPVFLLFLSKTNMTPQAVAFINSIVRLPDLEFMKEA